MNFFTSKGRKTKSAQGEPRWSVSPQGKFLFNGKEYYSYGWTAETLRQKLANMRRVIVESGHTIVIEAIQIEPGVASDLWNARVITIDDLDKTIITGNSITLEISFDGSPLIIDIREHMYYQEYQFCVSNHPKGWEIMRDAPDTLAILAREEWN